MADDSKALARTFTPETQASLAELRRIAKEAKGRDDPRLRRATPEEVALAESQRQPHHCVATSTRTGLPCTKSRVVGMQVCRTHGGSTKHVIAKAEQRLLGIADAVVGRLHELAMQDGHKPTAQRAASDILDRIGLGAVVQAKVRSSQRGDSGSKVVVNIGFLNPQGTEAPIIVSPTPRPTDDEG